MNAFQAIPQKVRFAVYILATLVGAGIGAWQAAEGNVLEAVSLFAAALIPLMSASNSAPGVTVTTAPTITVHEPYENGE